MLKRSKLIGYIKAQKCLHGSVPFVQRSVRQRQIKMTMTRRHRTNSSPFEAAQRPGSIQAARHSPMPLAVVSSSHQWGIGQFMGVGKSTQKLAQHKRLNGMPSSVRAKGHGFWPTAESFRSFAALADCRIERNSSVQSI